MTKLFSTLAVSSLLLTSLAATAATAPGAKTSAAAPLKCPTCAMPMPTAKSATMTAPIYVTAKKKVYYCCPQCKSGAAATAYFKKNKKPMHVG